MARIALVGLDAGSRLAAGLALAGHEIVDRDLGAAATGYDLAIVDLDAAATDGSACQRWTTAAPSILLYAGPSSAGPGEARSGASSALRKPFDLTQLRAETEKLLKIVPASGSAWLCYPLVPRSEAAVLAAALRLARPLWIVGEAGSGRRSIAQAIAQEVTIPAAFFAWRDGEPVRSLLDRLSAVAAAERAAVLYVANAEQRSGDTLDELLSALDAPALRAVRLIAATGTDALAGDRGLSPVLRQRLQGLEVCLPPLRERSDALPDIVEHFASRLATPLGLARVSFGESALAQLRLYPWPGNLAELEAVLVRTLVQKRAAADTADCVVRAEDLAFAPRPLLPTASPLLAPAPERRSVLVSLEEAQRRADQRSAVPVAQTAATAETTNVAVRTDAEPMATAQAALGKLLAGLAHDLRNPMSTVKTFAELFARSEPAAERSELARLAVEACDRMDHHVEALQMYAALDEPSPIDLDLVDALTRALGERDAGAAARVLVDLKAPVRLHADPRHAAFVLALLLDEIEAELAERASAVIGYAGGDPTAAAIEILIPTGRRPVAHLRRFVERAEDELSWRLLLARAVIERNGGLLEAKLGDRSLLLQWMLSIARIEEEEANDEKADSAHRRRRSRRS